MELHTPEPERVEVLDYEFTFADGRTLVVSVWPTLGDKIDESIAGRTEFVFPRLRETQVVYHPHIIAALYRQTFRVYIDQVELRKRLKEQKALDAKAKE